MSHHDNNALNKGNTMNTTSRMMTMSHLVLLAAGALHAQSIPASAVMAPAAPAMATGAAADTGPTYLRDVLPILMGKCSRCHNNQTRFVYNWLDYKTAYADRFEIKRRIWDSVKGSYYKEPMPIENSPESFAISEQERLTIRDWVRAGAPRGATVLAVTPKDKDERIAAGKTLFNSICAACHQPTGLGVPKLFPPLAGSDFLNADKARAIGIVLNGRQGEVIVNGQKFNNNMPAIPLGDVEISSVLTYVYNAFGNSGQDVLPEEVNGLRGQPAPK
jgi:mono/diheme cytochrome c family protein